MDTLQQSPPAEPEGGLRRNLKKRHLLMMSLGGTIGTGLFIGIAEPLSSVGPAGTLLAYLFAGTIMLATMMCLGELSCAFPHSGSFQHYALMFMPSPCWSYTIGWLYWFSWVFSLAADLTAAGFIAHQFFPAVPVYMFCLAIAVLALVYPHELTPNGQSPFVWVFSHAGIPGADTLMTLVIFSAAVSAANSAIYASSRMLWSMAGDRFAPACFGKTNGGGVPVYAILITALLALVSLLTRYIPAQQFYLYLIASTGQVGCLAWITIGWCQYRFRQSVRNGTYASDLLRYRSPLFPWTARFVIITNFAIMVGTWFSEQGVVIMLVELAFMIGILLSWYLFRPTLSRLRNTVG
ncbi:amino acid permease [Salmonella enterica]|uniref:Amino acid permease n=2 Tax=Salmonella enterica TaxID=28901 RepID=A0A748S9U8_SALER|nr:amino acid permease [Salmonella enterica]EAW2048385.1 amino acid permease [Salmonella enterica subsp. enterica]ECG2748053.1 amino acid permease [Salmonella enterica subsp. enterica serovar Typhi]EEM2971242.1 amino acid permease [Salmonella enterica subsp. enterica serovar Dublin]EAM2271026.1 amino acid permease [Salmonella enterica]EAM4679639.1 amino acid permease [Salmonella enterica]